MWLRLSMLIYKGIYLYYSVCFGVKDFEKFDDVFVG